MIFPVIRLSLPIKQLLAMKKSRAILYRFARLSTVSPACTMIAIQPAGWGQDADGRKVFVAVGVSVLTATSGVRVGGNVFVAVIGRSGIGAVAVADISSSGINPTSEMDNAPMVNAMESNAVVSAFPNARMPRIAYFLFCQSTEKSPEIGNNTLNMAPVPNSLSTQIRPRWASVSVLAMERPTPVSPTP